MSFRDFHEIPNNAGSIHNRDTAPLLVTHSNKKSVSKLFEMIRTNWEIFFYSLTIIITLCGESIFRKSVSTIMYNYRWFILILLNMLSFLFYLLIMFYRKIKRYMIRYQRKKKEEERRLQRNKERLKHENSRISINTDSRRDKIEECDSNSDLISNISLLTTITETNDDDEKQQHAFVKKDARIKSKYLNWRSYIIISLLDSLHMIFIFIPIGVLPANIVMCLPLIGISIFSLFNCCISCDNQYIKLGYDNIFGCLLLFLSIFLLIFQDKTTSKYLTDNTLNYDKKYISNLILFFIGCFILLFSDIYKRICLSKIKIDMIEFNLIQSILSIVILYLLSPLAFQIQYISKYNNENSHVTNITHSFSNIKYGVKCLFGVNTYNTNIKDLCNNITFAYPIIHFIILLIFMILNRLSQNKLFKNKTYLKYINNKNSFVQHLISISIIFTFLFCYVKEIQNLWNNKNRGIYQINLKMDWETPVIVILLSIGALLSFRKIDERKVSIKLLEDQWIIS